MQSVVKPVLAALAATLVTFLLSAVFYGFVATDFYTWHFGHIARPAEELRLWALVLEKLVRASLMAYIYPKVYQGHSPATEGAKFGVMVGLLVGVPWMLSTWADYPVTAIGVMVVGIVNMIGTIAAGVIIGVIYGRFRINPTRAA